ncbi:MAG: hypothetical protein WBN85_10580 [Candidatus Macondimonas sp.]
MSRREGDELQADPQPAASGAIPMAARWLSVGEKAAAGECTKPDGRHVSRWLADEWRISRLG